MSARWGRRVPAESAPKWMSPTAATRIIGSPPIGSAPMSACRTGLPGRSSESLHAGCVTELGDNGLVVDLVLGQDLAGDDAHRLPALLGGNLAGEEDLAGGNA